jgi:hypothetical protein
MFGDAQDGAAAWSGPDTLPCSTPGERRDGSICQTRGPKPAADVLAQRANTPASSTLTAQQRPSTAALSPSRH